MHGETSPCMCISLHTSVVSGTGFIGSPLLGTFRWILEPGWCSLSLVRCHSGMVDYLGIGAGTGFDRRPR